jgi:hypothetical protein
VKLLESDRARRSHCGEWDDISRISARITSGHGEVAMLCPESMPHRISEEVLW